MKKTISIILSIIMTVGAIALPVSTSAATSRVKLKSSEAALRLTSRDGKTVRGNTRIRVTAQKGVKLKKLSYKSSDASVAVVRTNGRVVAKKQGSAKITVSVRFTYNKKSYTRKLGFRVKVTDRRRDDKLAAFSNKLYALCAQSEKGNYTMSPLSVYFALAMLYETGDAQVKSEILALTEMSDSDIAKTGEIFKKLCKSYTDFEGKEIAKLSLTNSIWYDDSENPNEKAVKSLEDKLSCTLHKTPFSTDNRKANKEIREFIKKETNGMIDRDFALSPSTLYALINTLYFKDVWDMESRNGLSTEKRAFKTADGTKKVDFLEGEYLDGRVQETDEAQYFYAQTAHGYKVKFVLPKSGHTLKEAMNPDSLTEINAKSDFKPVDANGTKHYTRCIFPKFKIESETPLKQILEKNANLSQAFTGFDSPLTDSTPLKVSDIKHHTVLDVNEKGVEGAAVTVIAMEAAAAPDFTPKKFHDFVLNRAFGFIVTTPDDVVMFAGQVKNP